MTNNEILTLLVSGAALLVSGYSAIQYRLANENAKKALIKADEAHSTQKAALSLQEAALESQITSSIATAAGMVQQAALALSNIAESAHNYDIFKKTILRHKKSG